MITIATRKIMMITATVIVMTTRRQQNDHKSELHDMETVSAFLTTLCGWNSPHKGPVIWNFDIVLHEQNQLKQNIWILEIYNI